MYSKISPRYAILVISIALIVSSSAIISVARGQNGTLQIGSIVIGGNKSPVTSPAVSLGFRLKIPKIHVDAQIDLMGLTKAGAMESPVGGKNVGWFKLGTYPGAIGSAVIAGHYGPWKNGDGSVFDNLSSLTKGDKIYVQDASGRTATFIVRESRMYDPKADASDVFGSNDCKAHLNLITCEGIWNKATKTYSARRIVFTDKEII